MHKIHSLLILLGFILLAASAGADAFAIPDTQVADGETTLILTSTATQTIPFTNPPDLAFMDEIPMAIVEPSAGVTTATGLVVEVHCLCPDPDYYTWMANQNGLYFADGWDVVYLATSYREGFPYDFGKYQVIDMYRAIGKTLEMYPDIDRRRIYLWGISGGGQIGLSMLASSTVAGDAQGEYPGLFASSFCSVAITKITTAEDRDLNGYEVDPDPNGWTEENEWLQPTVGLSNVELAYRAAERQLRTPQYTAQWIPTDPNSVIRYFEFHGTADEIVDYQHHLDFRDAIGNLRPGGLLPSGVWDNVLWADDFLLGTIEGGTHNFSGAVDPTEDTFPEILEKYGSPFGFLTIVNPNPLLADHGVMPELDTHLISDVNVNGEVAARRGWHIQGPLNAVTLFETTNTSSASGWFCYQ
ncbi:hypothetical protein KQI84_13890 [bacterium]|nr:hypothetical protein [bacterium]